jgi:SpoVK/Ycf46/Vps4 family AAA+-type ATPase
VPSLSGWLGNYDFQWAWSPAKRRPVRFDAELRRTAQKYEARSKARGIGAFRRYGLVSDKVDLSAGVTQFD